MNTIYMYIFDSIKMINTIYKLYVLYVVWKKITSYMNKRN